ncbi:DUF881 domain-containing protein [Geodermatophilus nigrescens]|uniref:Uncharacterized conserved protein YlxW, UPF0749 family n=1 Tax=Geodermatophilus nigrescens TaxID=1070870 RepID=A0A1M5HU36_9ACTN|nr:DUF881 domain-containing protein [Geodermatophilus nigrescens]SHG19466.1 Uncharacterized conserved protein YlxW, UPF0749 family [Geodermatophilus nigrescens]
MSGDGRPGDRPEGAVPEETAPEDAAPEGAVPEETAPEETAPEGAVPEDAVPEDAAPEPRNDVPESPAEPVAARATPPRRRRSSLVAASLIAVLTVLLGFAIAVQVRSTDTGEALEGVREEDLIGILDDLDAQEERLRAQIADQRADLRELSDSDSQAAAALEDATSRADSLAILNGTVAAEGPGLVVTIRDPEGQVRVADLLDAVQELRGAGAETMQIDGVRIGVSTAVTGTPGALRIDGRPVEAPYEVVVIGSAQDLRTAMSIPGGVVDRVGRQGGSVDIEQRDRVVVDALRPLDEPQYAQPDPGD